MANQTQVTTNDLITIIGKKELELQIAQGQIQQLSAKLKEMEEARKEAESVKKNNPDAPSFLKGEGPNGKG